MRCLMWTLAITFIQDGSDEVHRTILDDYNFSHKELRKFFTPGNRWSLFSACKQSLSFRGFKKAARNCNEQDAASFKIFAALVAYYLEKLFFSEILKFPSLSEKDKEEYKTVGRRYATSYKAFSLKK